LVVAVLLIGLTTVASGAGAQQGRSLPALSAERSIHYGADGEVDAAACPPPTPGHATCLARIRTDMLASGARPDGMGAHLAPSDVLGDNGAYSPAYLQSAYNAPSATRGTGETVGVVDAYDDPNAESDLSVYRSHYGLPPCTTANGCFRKVDQNGVTVYPATAQNGDWEVETSLDLDMVSAICPKCHILLVEGNDAGDNSLFTAEDTAAHLGANVVSNSWGAAEVYNEPNYDEHFSHAGVAVTAGTGDWGFGGATLYPAASPDVIAVGGTSLYQTGSTGSRNATETAWSGSGSGCSLFEPKPSWQHDSCPGRAGADISAVGDPSTPVWVYDTYPYFGSPPNWSGFGGTSASSPIVAALYALAAGPSAPAYQPAGLPYSQPAAFNDVTAGSTATCDTWLCQAGPGYDGPTGLGTPNGIRGFEPSLPGAPQDLASGSRSRTIVLSWSPPADAGGSRLGGYRIYRDGGLVASLPATAHTFTATKLVNGQSHTWKVSAFTTVGEGPGASVPAVAAPLDQITVSPSNAEITAEGSQSFRVEGFDRTGNSLGDETAAAKLVAPRLNCTGTSCTSSASGTYRVTAIVGGAKATAKLRVDPGSIWKVVVKPSVVSLQPGRPVRFAAFGRDFLGNPAGSLTAKVRFSISPEGTCHGAVCTAARRGIHHVTATIPSSSVSTGWGEHSCATTTIGLRCWGENQFGETGSTAYGDAWTPSTVSGIDAASVVAAQGYTCVITASGGAKCWGYNSEGRLGNATATSSITPTDVVGLTSGVASLAATNNACAITSSRALKCWGDRFSDGDGSKVDRWRPVDVVGLGSGVASVSTSGDGRSGEVLGRQHHGRARKRCPRQRCLPLSLPHTWKRRRPD
jgi:hypothetical protein